MADSTSPNERLWALFDDAADLPPAEQRAFLDAACAGDAALRAEVERLLDGDRRSQDDPTDDFLKSPLIRPGDSPPGPAEPTAIGRYHIVRVLGAGGMGTVYEAVQESPRRTVALKVIRPGLLSPPLLRRFTREAQILGLLSHPGIASIHEASVTDDGTPFFAMELVRGLPLDEYARQRNLDAAGRLELVARVCEAVQHAHDHGVVHRDLKPSNVLVDEAGQPRVLDFGVARWLDDEARSTSGTQTGQLIGTPRYMSPEQIAGDPNLDRRSDVYTLGVLLFELLAGRLPHPVEGLPLGEAVRVIQEREPARLGAIDRRLRGDIETLVGKTLEKEPERRYASAREMAADIRRLLRHEPIQAKPPSLVYRLGRLARRHRALVSTSAALLLLLLVAGAVAAWQAVRLANAERDQILQRAQRGQEVQDALARAGVLREQARNPGDQTRAWAEARAMARRAEAFAESGPVDGDLAGRVAALLAELADEEKERRLLTRLDRAPLLQAELNARQNLFAEERALPEYRKAFADFGLRPAETPPADAVGRLQRCQAPVHAAALAALDHWLDLARLEESDEAPWLEGTLAAADSDDWRQRVRVARGKLDRDALLDLARSKEVARQRPQAVLSLFRGLRIAGENDAAIRLLTRARESNAGDFWINQNLGRTLLGSQPPRFEEASRFLTAAVALRPDSPGARVNLGLALAGLRRFDEAIAEYHQAIQLEPAYAQAHANLGWALAACNRFDEAVAAYREVVSLVPDSAATHEAIGSAYLKLGRLPEAEASLRRAVELDPDLAGAQADLGTVLQGRGDLPAAAACIRRAVKLAPKVALPRYNLGNVLWAQADLPGAAAAFREVLAIEPEHAEAHCNLGHVLLSQGTPRVALASFKKGHELGSRRKDWRYPSAEWLRNCQRFVELEEKLPSILAGKERPEDADECLELSELCRCKGLLVRAVRLAGEAFAADAELADDLAAGHRLRAAVAAVRAARGEGQDADKLDEPARARLREQALRWLRADLDQIARELKGAAPPDQARLKGLVRGWQSQPSLAGVRGGTSLDALPPAERAGWQRLWVEAQALLEQNPK